MCLPDSGAGLPLEAEVELLPAGVRAGVEVEADEVAEEAARAEQAARKSRMSNFGRYFRHFFLFLPEVEDSEMPKELVKTLAEEKAADDSSHPSTSAQRRQRSGTKEKLQ